MVSEKDIQGITWETERKNKYKVVWILFAIPIFIDLSLPVCVCVCVCVCVFKKAIKRPCTMQEVI